LEAILCRITTPRLEKFYSTFLEPTSSVPSLPRFIKATKNLRFGRAEITFTSKQARVALFSRRSRKGKLVYALSVNVDCEHLDVQVFFAARISNLLSQAFSSVDHLTLEHSVHSQSSEEHNEVDHSEWRKFLISFRNVRTLRIEGGLVKALSRFLNSEDGELPVELLPKLQTLRCFRIGDSESVSDDEFTSFIDARRNAGCPVSLFYHGDKSSKPSVPSTNIG
jgi:hypothetical protein